MSVATDTYLPVLLVDDEPDVLELTRMTLGSEGIHHVVTIQDSRKVMPFLKKQKVAAVVLDIMMPFIPGTDLLQSIVNDYPEVPVILMTASDDIETAIECLKTGAFDYLLKPVEPGRLVGAVEKALKLNKLKQEVISLKEYLLSDSLKHAGAFEQIITRSKKMRAIFKYVEAISKTRQPVLITGETGVGKELMACAIHKVSDVQGAFVPVNVAGLDDDMFSDTLFGHCKGAFTNADSAREGLIGKAASGTLFLDEIGDLSPKSQVKLLRLLQSQDYYPLGSDILKSTNAHIVLATNQDIAKLVADGRFRRDLYYRLCSYTINIPALGERQEDIPLLLDLFIEEASRTLNKQKPAYAADLAEVLATRAFPGNIRELKALVNDAVARHATGILTLKHFPQIASGAKIRAACKTTPLAQEMDPLSSIFGRFPTIEEVEKYMIRRALAIAAGRRSDTASLLGISRQALYKRMKFLKT